MPSKSRNTRNITNELLCISETIEKEGNDTPKQSAWAVPNSSTSKVAIDMWDTNLLTLMEMFPNCEASRVQALLEQHGDSFDRALEALLCMVNVASKIQEPASYEAAQKPIFMHPVRSNSPTATLLTQTSPMNATQETAKHHAKPETPKDEERSTTACSEWCVRKPRKKKPSAPKASAEACESGKSLRQQARACDKTHKHLLSMATSLRHRGKPAESDLLLLHAEQVRADRDALNQRAARALFEEMNPQLDGALSIDLHYLAEHEALALLARHLPGLAAAARRSGTRWATVVTGAGTHSVGGRGVLEPAVEAWLRRHSIAVQRGDPGVLRARAADVVLRDA
jgi:DNA-nicking Smr family endonuclease